MSCFNHSYLTTSPLKSDPHHPSPRKTLCEHNIASEHGPFFWIIYLFFNGDFQWPCYGIELPERWKLWLFTSWLCWITREAIFNRVYLDVLSWLRFARIIVVVDSHSPFTLKPGALGPRLAGLIHKGAVFGATPQLYQAQGFCNVTLLGWMAMNHGHVAFLHLHFFCCTCGAHFGVPIMLTLQFFFLPCI